MPTRRITVQLARRFQKRRVELTSGEPASPINESMRNQFTVARIYINK